MNARERAALERRRQVDRVRRLVVKAKADCAYPEGAEDSVCFWLDELPCNVREVQWALSEGFCPLCFWVLIRFFGVKRVDDVEARSGS